MDEWQKEKITTISLASLAFIMLALTLYDYALHTNFFAPVILLLLLPIVGVAWYLNRLSSYSNDNNKTTK